MVAPHFKPIIILRFVRKKTKGMEGKVSLEKNKNKQTKNKKKQKKKVSV